MKPENIELRDKIINGVNKANTKFLEEKAINNDIVIISDNGVIKKVPAREILEKRRQEKG